MKIGEINKGTQFNVHCYITNLTERLTKKGDPFVTVSFRDETGERNANMWGTSLLDFRFKINDVVEIFGVGDEYQGVTQLNVSAINSSSEPIESFTKTSDQNIEQMFASLEKSVLSRFKDPFLNFLVQELILKEKEMFLKAPAAKSVHHAWIGGLLEHILGLCRLAHHTYRNHYERYFPEMDMEKVYFGLVFHDWGKLFEYDYSTPNFRYTVQGCLQHHIGIVAEKISRAAQVFETQNPGTKVDLQELLHIIYSHHGEIEWGAIVRPATQEALFIHMLDLMDARMMHMFDTLKVKGNIEGMSQFSNMHKTSYMIK